MLKDIALPDRECKLNISSSQVSNQRWERILSLWQTLKIKNKFPGLFPGLHINASMSFDPLYRELTRDAILRLAHVFINTVRYFLKIQRLLTN